MSPLVQKAREIKFYKCWTSYLKTGKITLIATQQQRSLYFSQSVIDTQTDRCKGVGRSPLFNKQSSPFVFASLFKTFFTVYYTYTHTHKHTQQHANRYPYTHIDGSQHLIKALLPSCTSEKPYIFKLGQAWTFLQLIIQSVPQFRSTQRDAKTGSMNFNVFDFKNSEFV